MEKTSVKQDLKCKLFSNFQMSFFHLSQIDPLDETSGQVNIFSQIFGSGWPLVRCTPQ